MQKVNVLLEMEGIVSAFEAVVPLSGALAEQVGGDVELYVVGLVFFVFFYSNILVISLFA